MKALMKCAGNEHVYGMSAQMTEKGVQVKTYDTNPSRGKKLVGTVLGAIIGSAIPVGINLGKAIMGKDEVRDVSFQSMLGSGTGALVGRKLGERIE